jgi:type VI protein secretion system component Hcp
MSRSVHLTLEGESGPIDIDSFTDGTQKEASILVRFFELMGKTGVDQKTGRPKGSREYTGVKLQKRLDKASPALFELFANNTPFQATFDIGAADFTGSGNPGETLATITVGSGRPKNCFLVSYCLTVPDVEKPVGENPDEPFEELIFSFDSIEFKKVGGDFMGKPHTIIVKDSHTGSHK